ncbi:hypothetical protein [Cellulosimicrobium sp. CUA-896]|uniref:hypothetical protein n=1 Tax=Cellulosimicrobium sp. CUA-896 TaxID=1517881 RepID=UPI001C9E8998|nr:hypothetical protein [Cellulosimicrobium sp. CUA-896]
MLFSGTATPACKTKKAELTVAITNADSVPIDVRVDSPAGGYKFSKIPAGQTVKHTIPAKVAELAAGEAKLTAYKNVDGQGIQTISTAAYPATSCG